MLYSRNWLEFRKIATLHIYERLMFKNGMRPVHPGAVLLEDYIKPMGVSVRAVALALHVPYSRLSSITKGRRGVTADTALRLERYFGSEATGWLNLQSAYDLRVAEISTEMKAAIASIERHVGMDYNR
jgi:addiction module HigA family antidote